MKKKPTSWPTLLHLRVLASLLILLFSILLLTPGLSSKANAQADNNRQFPLPNVPLQEKKVVPSDVGTDSYFGRAVAIDGSTALIGAIGDNGFQGAAYLFTESNGIWSEGQKLTASDGLPGDEFGRSVVLADDILVIGAPGDPILGASGPGAVYVFRKSGDTWVESQKLMASDSADEDDFGVAIAISGGTLVVGADNATIDGQLYQGAAYVFIETKGIWSQAQKLTGDDSAAFDHLGSAVAARGSTILVGAPSKNILSGEVYVFSGANNLWNQTQSLIANDSEFFDQFGASLALGGATALVGAPFATANGHAAQGAAYVFAISGGMLTQTQKITSSDGANNDAFGSSVALTEDLAAHRALIGAPSATVGRNKLQGKAYVFQKIDDNDWGQRGRIIAGDGALGDFFPFAVALSRETALLGVTPSTLPHEGAAYFYTAAAGKLP